jgi:hypothetical protein
MEILKDILVIIGGIIGLITFGVGVLESRKQGRQKRFELFLDIEEKFQSNSEFQKLRRLLTDSEPSRVKEEIAKTDKRTRRDYAAFFETIALMRNSGLITKEVACYMFSFDAIKCWRSSEFWHDFENKNDEYWGVLRLFVEEREQLRPKLEINRTDMSF